MDGFELPMASLSVVAEHQLMGRRVAQSRRQAEVHDDFQENAIRSLTEMTEGSPVVHIDHGVGRFPLIVVYIHGRIAY